MDFQHYIFELDKKKMYILYDDKTKLDNNCLPLHLNK